MEVEVGRHFPAACRETGFRFCREQLMLKAFYIAAFLGVFSLAAIVFAQLFIPGGEPESSPEEDGKLLVQDKEGEDEEARKPRRREREPDPLVTDEVKLAIGRGLEWLCRAQNKRGDWQESEWSLAISSMAGFALASGDHPGHGRYREALKKLTDYILSSVSPRGLIYCSSNTRPALGHGFAMLFLTQVYGMFDQRRNEKIRHVIRNGIRYMLICQTPSGGWYEDYSNIATHYWIITVSQIQALRAARACGFKVPKNRIARAIKFVQTQHW
jgi:hypothetical protein